MELILVLFILFISIILHEIAHGYVAYLFGDDTAYRSGRLTLNPLAHIDPLGTIILPLLLVLSHTGFMLGWAKPVPVNMYGMREPRRGMMYVAIAGPLTNLTIAFILSLLLRIGVSGFWTNVLFQGISLNVMLAGFNLIPLPPLDGSRIVAYFLRGTWQRAYDRLEPYGLVILFVLLYLGLLDRFFILLNPVINWFVR